MKICCDCVIPIVSLLSIIRPYLERCIGHIRAHNSRDVWLRGVCRITLRRRNIILGTTHLWNKQRDFNDCGYAYAVDIEHTFKAIPCITMPSNAIPAVASSGVESSMNAKHFSWLICVRVRNAFGSDHFGLRNPFQEHYHLKYPCSYSLPSYGSSHSTVGKP